MDTATTPQIRNVALVGHAGSGKTTLVEALLHRAGVTTRPGRVEDGTTVTDHEPEAIAHGISLSANLAPMTWTCATGATTKINLIDTPGFADFAGATDAALAVADLAVVVVSAVDGVEVGTEQVWAQCEAAGIPRLIFVTKEDRPRADFHAVLAELRARFGTGVVPLQLPLGEEESLHGVADVLTEESFDYDASGQARPAEAPDDVAAEQHELHEQVTEEIVSGDDDALERYLSGEVPSASELETSLAHEVLAGTAFPVLLGSALTGVGVDQLAEYVCELGPSPADRPTTLMAGDTEVEVTADPAGEPALLVFRTVSDPFVGQLSLFKVLSGTVRNDMRLVNATTGQEERLHGLFFLRGKEHLPTTTVVAGDIAAAPKLAGSPTGSVLAPGKVPLRFRGLPERGTPYAVALQPATQADDDKLSAALAKLVAEDPTLRVERVGGPGAGQTVMRGLGDVHVTVAIERLARKFGVEVRTEPVKVAYRETITRPTEAEGRLKKQSGGHGQFAIAQLRLRPLERGAGVTFKDSVVGGAIPRNYIPAVERGVREAMAAGGPRGFEVVDVEVECYDGKHHSVDSSEMAFRTAAVLGVKEALAKGGTTVLEPVCTVRVRVPTAQQGDVMGDLSARRGRISSTDVLDGDVCQIEALVPEAELTRYVADLRSITGGHGEFDTEFSHYEPVPDHLVAKLTES